MRRRFAGAVIVALSIWPLPARSQTVNPLHADEMAAKWFAPILWPAVNETIYPTIPHPVAFDGKDNDGNGLFDLDDPFEVQFAPGENDVVSLAAAFASLREKPPRRVIYSGPKVFERTDLDLLEYWFYYLYDQGPGAHRHDAEHTFVLLDVADRSASFGDLGRYAYQVKGESFLSKAVRLVVGAAHEGSTANNIVAATRQMTASSVVPRELPTHTPMLAELGKHATAPDLHLDGRFDPGLDANLFRGSLWGLRDSLTAGLGEIGFMNFEPWQTFPRHAGEISVEASYFTATDQSFLDTYRPYRQRLGSTTPAAAYSLFPLADMERLYELLAEDGTPEEIRDRVLSFLRAHRQCFWGESTGGWSGTIPLDIVPTLRQWVTRPPKHIRLWEHPDHREPRKVFKLHLFPRLSIGFAAANDIGFSAVKRVVFEISDLKWPALSGWGGILDFLFPGRLLTDSRLEISVGGTERKLSNPRRWAYQYDSITWKKGRGNRSGIYVGLQRRKAQVRPGREINEESLRDIAYETGIDLDVLRTRKGGKGWPVGLRSGVFFGHSWDGKRGQFPSGRVELQVGIVVEPQGTVSDVEAALGARPNIRFQLGTVVLWNTAFRRPEPWKH